MKPPNWLIVGRIAQPFHGLIVLFIAVFAQTSLAATYICIEGDTSTGFMPTAGNFPGIDSEYVLFSVVAGRYVVNYDAESLVLTVRRLGSEIPGNFFSCEFGNYTVRQTISCLEDGNSNVFRFDLENLQFTYAKLSLPLPGSVSVSYGLCDRADA